MTSFCNQLKILVMGCSSSGKSTFITCTLIPVLLEQFPSLDRSDIDVRFASDLMSNYTLGASKVVVVHYNSLYGLDYAPHDEVFDLKGEVVFKNLLDDDFHDVFYCYTPDEVLKSRIRSRSHIEPTLRKTRKEDYPRDQVLRSLSRISQRDVLLDAERLLKGTTKNFSVVFSQREQSMVISASEFSLAPRSEFLQKVLSDEKLGPEDLQQHPPLTSSLANDCARFLTR